MCFLMHLPHLEDRLINFICLNQISEKMCKQSIMHPSLTVFCAILCCNCEYCSPNLALKLLDNPFIGFLSPFQLKRHHYLILEGPKKRATKHSIQELLFLFAAALFLLLPAQCRKEMTVIEVASQEHYLSCQHFIQFCYAKTKGVLNKMLILWVFLVLIINCLSSSVYHP